MANLLKKTTNGKTSYRLQFAVGGKRRTLHLGSIRESAANKIKARIEDLVTDARLKNKPDEQAQQWILEADFETVKKLAGWGLLDSVAALLQRRRVQENPDLGNKDQRPTLLEFCQWYILQRESDCKTSTIDKITSSLNMLCDYCRDHETVTTVDDVNWHARTIRITATKTKR